MTSPYAISLYHADPAAPAGQGRALQAGDTVGYHDIVRGYEGGGHGTRAQPVPADARRWTLLASPVRHAAGYFEGQSIACRIDGIELAVWFSCYDIVGIGNMRIVRPEPFGSALRIVSHDNENA